MRKVQANVLLRLHLVDARQVVLNRVFGGGDVDVGIVEFREGAIERRGFARAVGPVT